MPDGNKPSEYAFDLDTQLATVIDMYEQGREAYWQTLFSGGEWRKEKELYEKAEEFASMLLAHAETLVGEGLHPHTNADLAAETKRYLWDMRVERDRLLKLIRDRVPEGQLPAIIRTISDTQADRRPPPTSPLKLVWERLCIHLAWTAVEDLLRPGAHRILQLIDLAVDAEPEPVTLQCLKRVGRCFVWGFDAECVILCRGVIDTAFRDAVADAVCEKYGRSKAKYGYTLAQRIEASLAEKLVNKDGYYAAIRVNERGSKAAHYDLDVTADVLGTLRDTLRVVQQLTPKQGGC